jgi:phage protein D
VAETTNTSGNAAAIFQIGLVLESGQIQEFNVQAESSFSTFTEYQESVNGVSFSHSTLDTTNSSFVNTLLAAAMASGNPDVMVRFGVGTPGNYWWSPWQPHIITEFVALPKAIGNNNGYHVKISTADAFVKASRSKKVQVRRGKISEIVAAIASENALEKTIIEPTRGTYSLIQSYESDTSFLLKRLLLRAANESGRGNFQVFIRDGALHFHTPDYQATIHELNYFTGTSGLELYQVDQSQIQLQRGAARVHVITYNPLTGETKSVTSKEDRALKLAKTTPTLSKVPQADLNLLMHVGQNLDADCENYAQSKFEVEHSQLYQLTLVTTKTPTIRCGDILTLNVQSSSEPSPWSGLYLVQSVRHAIENGSLTSAIILSRGELNKAGGTNFNDTAVYDASVLTSESDSPGQALNVAAVNSSTRSRGVESNTLKTVLSPN